MIQAQTATGLARAHLRELWGSVFQILDDACSNARFGDFGGGRRQATAATAKPSWRTRSEDSPLRLPSLRPAAPVGRRPASAWRRERLRRASPQRESLLH